MNFKKQLFFGGAIALLTVGLTGCANNTSSNSSNNQLHLVNQVKLVKAQAMN